MTIESCVFAQSLQSCPTLCNPMDCSLLGSSDHGILQARILEWVAISFSNIHINNYLKCKWIKCTTQKTWTGQVDTKTRPICMLSTRDLLHTQGHLQTESKGMGEDTPYKWKSKESWNSNTHTRQNLKRDKEGHYIIIKDSIQEDITIIYAFNTALQYVRQILTQHKGRN